MNQPSTKQPQIKRFEELKSRHEKLKNKKAAVDAELKAYQSQLEEVKKEALALFGTSDIGELRVMLKEINEKNEKNLKEAEAAITTAEQQLAEIELNLNQSK